MSNTILGNAFKAVADAIRAKGVTGTMSPLEMPAKVASIPSGGSSIKYGVDLDGMIGDVDANGVLQTPDPSQFSSTEIRSISDYALQYKFRKRPVTSVSLPNLTSIGNYGMQYAFYQDTALTTVDMSSVTRVEGRGLYSAFYGCYSLKTVYLSKLSSAGSSGLNYAFNGCTSLEIVDFSEATAVPTLSNINAFSNTNDTYRILVPPALYDSWIAANNWSNASIKPHIEKVGLRFKANTANSTIQLVKVGSAPNVSLEYSTDGGLTYSTYTVGDTIQLANVDDMVMFRAGSAGNARMASPGGWHYFIMTGSISAEGSVFYLLNKYGTVSSSVASHCFFNLFNGCSSLTSAPELPATVLGRQCYFGMFENCTSLTTAPELPATTLTDYCYTRMFKGCSSLNEIRIGYTGNFDSIYFGNWVNGVAASGTFYYAGSDTTTGASAIPTGWTVASWNYDGLTFTAEQAGSTIKLVKNSGAPDVTLDYTTDSTTWQNYTVGNTITLTNVGDKVGFIARTTNNTFGNNSNTSFNGWVGTGRLSVSGNINSLLDRNNYNTLVDISSRLRVFNWMFYNMTSLVSAEDLVLPSTTIGKFAYNNMFQDCTNMTKAPKDIAAVTISTTGDWPMAGMFKNTAITKSPHLHFTTTNTSNAYQEMFNGCSNLNEIKLDYTGNFGTGAFTNWVNGVAASGTFYYNGSYTGRGTNAIPNGWTITPFST